MKEAEINKKIAAFMDVHWHEWKRTGTNPIYFVCPCGMEIWQSERWKYPNPDYCSDDSPRSLLRPVIEKVCELERSEKTALAWFSGSKTKSFIRALCEVVGVEASDYNIAFKDTVLLVAATNGQIATAIANVIEEQTK